MNSRNIHYNGTMPSLKKRCNCMLIKSLMKQIIVPVEIWLNEINECNNVAGICGDNGFSPPFIAIFLILRNLSLCSIVCYIIL
jgi:hypothetical protein